MTHAVIPCHRRPLTCRPEARSGHVSIAYGPCIYIWGGYHELQVARWNDERYLSPSALWVFNTFTHEWTHQMCTGDLPKPSSGSCAVLHGHHMYLFAGFTDTHANLNSLYKLDLKTSVWSRADGLPHSEDYSDADTDDEGLHFQKKKSSTAPDVAPASMPSRRDKLCGWTYENRLFFFGGFGPRLDSDPTYMRDNGVWVADSSAASQMQRGWNNQVLCFDLDTKRWSTIATSGPRPLPRAAMCCAILGDRAYIFGGRHETTRRSDMISLNMRTLEWSPELVSPPDSEEPPSGRSWSSLSVVDRHLLFLYGGYDQTSTPLHDGFLFDVRDNRWTPLGQESLPNLGALPLAPTPAWMEPRPRPATTNGLFWHTAVSLFSPPTAAATPGVYVFGGMLTPISQTANMTFHSSHLLHFAFKPKSLTLLALEHLAQRLTHVERPALPDAAPELKSVDHNRALEWIESCLPRPLPAVLRSRVEALIAINKMETDATRRSLDPPEVLRAPRPTDGAGGILDGVDDDSSDEDEIYYHDANPHDDYVESDPDSYDSDDG